MAKLPAPRKQGVPWPFLVTPLSEEEACCGTATLVTPGQAQQLLDSLYKQNIRRGALVDKLKGLT